MNLKQRINEIIDLESRMITDIYAEAEDVEDHVRTTMRNYGEGMAFVLNRQRMVGFLKRDVVALKEIQQNLAA